jgi:hypothetical protein
MAWDATPLLEGDPDQPGELYIQVLADPDRPLPLAMIECAANLDIAIKITRQDSPQGSLFPHLTSYVLCFSGRCIDLSEMDMRLGAWQALHNVPNKSEHELHVERIAARIRR